MDKYELQRLRDLPIEGVAERLGMHVTRHKALCPFHDDHHASLSFSMRRNTFRCFACGAHGGTIDLVMKRMNMDFKEATKWLQTQQTLPLTPPYMEGSGNSCNSIYAPPFREGTGESHFDASRYARYFERPVLNEEARKFLFEERRINPKVVAWCRLTSWKDRQGVPWLQIPYYDREGRLTGVQNRNLVKGAWPRFRFPQGSECGIYNLPVLNLLRPGDELWIAEGCSDCWALLSAGHKAIAIPSATLLKKKDVELLRSLTPDPSQPHPQPLPRREGSSKASPTGGGLVGAFHMYPDRDAPGERLFLQLKEVLPSLVHHQLPPQFKDFSEYYFASPLPHSRAPLAYP